MNKFSAVKIRTWSNLFLTQLVLCCVLGVSANAQTVAPGGPGKDAQWATAGKQAVGTSASLESKVWFTLAQGVMTEVYYPDVTVANVHMLQFVVVDSNTKKVETEWENTTSKTVPLTAGRTTTSQKTNPETVRRFHSPTSMAFSQNNLSESGKWEIIKTFFTDPKSNSILFSVRFRTDDPSLELYVYYDPSLANSGRGDSGWTDDQSLVSADGNVASALKCDQCKMSDLVSGFFGSTDGLTQLRQNGKIVEPFSRANNGNIVQTAKVTPISAKAGSTMIFALSFAATATEARKTAQNALAKGFNKVLFEYQDGWIDYLAKIPKVDVKYQAQFNMAAMQLRALEDKTARGANIASLTVPWGGGENANENNVGGYHLVWSRDLYQVFTAFLALGDKAAAERALDFLLRVQQKPDGSFPQNSWLDGRPFWGSLQMDEVAYPLIMAWQLGRFDKATWQNHVKKAADFIVKNGPSTPQERWEEESGYSPSTIAAEIAGLVCAADIAKRNGDNASADLYLKTADGWESNIEKWTATKTGKYGDGNYYVRITQNGKPDAGEKIEINNGAGFFDERDIIDAGFLELVRLGIRRADDPLIVKSVKVVDQVLKVDTPNGPGFYRYNNDGYGEMDDGRRWNWDGKYTGKGRLWALLSGERGQYELALQKLELFKMHSISGRNKTGELKIDLSNVTDSTFGGRPGPKGSTVNRSKTVASGPWTRLDHMLGFANEGLMIPEQVWDKKETPKNIDRQFIPELKFGEGTGSATPLAWSMAQFIRLATNLQAGRNLDTPQVVFDRYASKNR